MADEPQTDDVSPTISPGARVLEYVGMLVVMLLIGVLDQLGWDLGLKLALILFGPPIILTVVWHIGKAVAIRDLPTRVITAASFLPLLASRLGAHPAYAFVKLEDRSLWPAILVAIISWPIAILALRSKRGARHAVTACHAAWIAVTLLWTMENWGAAVSNDEQLFRNIQITVESLFVGLGVYCIWCSLFPHPKPTLDEEP